MAANLQLYSDAACTTELAIESGSYQLQIGPETGIDGTNGGTAIEEVWVKNTGDILISNVTLTETLDTPNRGSYSLDDISYHDTTVTLGNMDENDIVKVYIKVTVAPETPAGSNIPLNFSVGGTHI